MGTSSRRDRIVHDSDAPGVRGSRGQRRGGAGVPRADDIVDGLGNDHDGSPMAALIGQLGQIRQQGPGLQEAARDAAGRGRSAMADAAGRAARASQSAGSALAGRMADVSGRMADHDDDQGDTAAARTGLGRGTVTGGRADAGHRAASHRDWRPSRHTAVGSWPQQRDHASPDSTAEPRGRTRDRDHAGRRGPSSRDDRVNRTDLAYGQGRANRDDLIDRADLANRADLASRRDIMNRRDLADRHDLAALRATAGRDDDDRAWQPRDTRHLGSEIATGQGARGVSTRHLKRIARAQDAADDAAQRAADASENAMRHGRSRRARNGERKALTQAERAERMLTEQLARAERRMASSRQRRRRGVGLVMLAGAAAGIAIAVRRMLRKPGPRPEDVSQPTATAADLAANHYPTDDRMPEAMRDDLIVGRGTETMSDSTSRRF